MRQICFFALVKTIGSGVTQKDLQIGLEVA
jgi:hypothetical protein